MALTLEAFGIDRLTPGERMELIGLIWDSLPDAVDPKDVPGWHVDVLAKRLAAADAGPGAGRPWREVLDSLGGQP